MPDFQVVPGGASDGEVREQDKIFLILCYLGPFALIPLLTVKDSDYVRWHARQGATLCGAAVAYYLIAAILSLIPFVIILMLLLSFFVSLAYFGASIYCIVKAINGERWKLPVLGDLAQKF